MARGVTELEKAYALVQDLDAFRSNHAFSSHDHRAPVSRLSRSTQPHKYSTHPPHIRMMLRARVLNETIETKAPKGNFSRLVPLLNSISAKDMGIWLSIAQLR